MEVNKIKEKFHKAIRKSKPIGLLFFPDIKTIVLVYVLVIALYFRQNIDTFVFSLVGEHMKSFYELLSKNVFANWLTVLFVILTGGIITYRVSRRKSYSWLIISCLFLLVFLLGDNYWEWAKTPFGFNYRWGMVCLLFAIVISALTILMGKIKITPRFVTEDKISKGFSVTTSSDAMQDTGWQQYAENLAAKLLMTNVSKESFAVGVTGVWGSGKTTFLDALKKELAEKVYLVEFNPWNSDSAGQISDDFFRSLMSKLTISSYQRRSVLQYAKLLGQVNALGSHTNVVTSLLEDSLTPVSDAKDKVANVIGSLPLPVVVLIDDLDRLDGSELMAVLRLVRVTANFKNLLFVVAYDKDYVTRSLLSEDVEKGDEFLKKIFPLEVCLPAFESFVLVNHLYSELKNCLDDERLLSRLEIRIFRGLVRHKISYYLPTFRDVKRFSNQFCLNVNSFIRAGKINEIDVVDFFTLELLHYYDFAAYQKIQYDPLSLLSYGFNIEKKNAFSYREIGSIRGVKGIEEKDEKRRKILEGFKDGVSDILYVLFGSTAVKGDNLLRYPTNFSKYFSYRINKDVISIEEFNQFLDLDTKEELAASVKEYCQGNVSRRESLAYHLTSLAIDSNNEKQAFNAAFALLELALYGGINPGATFKIMFDKSRYKDAGVIPQALIKATEDHIGQAGSWHIIQDILTSLVEFDFIDQTDDNGGYVEYASVLNISQLRSLANKNFLSALGNRKIAIQKITDEKSRFHKFLKNAVAEVSVELYDGEHENRESESLLIDTLMELYGVQDNKAGLKLFFENLNPETDDYVLEGDDFYYALNKNISSVFGHTYKNKAFYDFIKTAFSAYIPDVNVQLKKFNLECIPESNEPEAENIDNPAG